jgi:diguanylate cyclase (GGDEF)-like protein/PAS domain S-box-containing protein
MAEIQRDMDLSKRVDIDVHNADIGEMAKTFNALVGNLQHANERLELFAKLFDNSGEAIIITDAERNIVAANPAFVEITGYQVEEVMGKNPKILSSGKQSADFYQEMWRAINEMGYWQGEIWNKRKNGEIFPEWISLGVVKNNKGEIINYISLFTDITKRKESEKHIQFLAHYDLLTQLPNRALFGDRLLQALATAKRSSKKVALLFLDLDRFKNINDTLGHQAGDLLLQSVAERLKSCVREMDTVCRQGGDEFMVLLTEIDKAEDAAHVAMKIVASMSEEHPVEGARLVVTFSIGISLYPDDAADSQSMMKNADTAMYLAKEKGRNNYQFFNPEMNARM